MTDREYQEYMAHLFGWRARVRLMWYRLLGAVHEGLFGGKTR